LSSPAIIILRERQLLLRLLKLYVVVNDVHLYQLKEQEPLIIDEQELPVKIAVKNGFHFSKPFYIKNYPGKNILLGVGCKSDNGSLWGAVVFSLLFFVVFFVTGFHIVLILANLPLLFLFYQVFIQSKEFITIETLKP
jgi:hypothetical protein